MDRRARARRLRPATWTPAAVEQGTTAIGLDGRPEVVDPEGAPLVWHLVSAPQAGQLLVGSRVVTNGDRLTSDEIARLAYAAPDRADAFEAVFRVEGGRHDLTVRLDLTVTPGIDSAASGSLLAERFDTGAGNDTVRAGGGNDTILAGDGDDILDGGFGLDLMIGGAGDDIYEIHDRGDSIVELAGGGTDLVRSRLTIGRLADGVELAMLLGGEDLALTANQLDNRLRGNSGNNEIRGLSGGDVLFGLTGDDTLNGGSENDRLVGGVGHDLLAGDQGADTLIGGEGNDLLAGGTGADVLVGGEGSDRFVLNFSARDTDPDRIIDFDATADVIVLTGGGFRPLGAAVDAQEFVVGPRALDAGDRLIYNAATGILSFDMDGSGSRAMVEIARLDARLRLDHTDFMIA